MDNISGYKAEAILHASLALRRAGINTLVSEKVFDGRLRFERSTYTYLHCDVEWLVHLDNWETARYPTIPPKVKWFAPDWMVELELAADYLAADYLELVTNYPKIANARIVFFKGSIDRFDEDMIMARLLA
jgi:hypothetical protein